MEPRFLHYLSLILITPGLLVVVIQLDSDYSTNHNLYLLHTNIVRCGLAVAVACCKAELNCRYAVVATFLFRNKVRGGN
jgi:hypothetical protein